MPAMGPIEAIFAFAVLGLLVYGAISLVFTLLQRAAKYIDR